MQTIPIVRHSVVVAFVLAFVSAMAVGLLQGEKQFYYDYSAYWALSDVFTNHGGFSLLDFGDWTRGYPLPLIFLLLKTVGHTITDSDWLLVLVFNATLFALVGTVLLPRLASLAWPQDSWGVPRRLALFGLVLAFWHGYLSYPLSDFPALTAALIALVAVSSSESLRWMAVAGAAAALALEIRPAYLLLFPLLVLLVGWSWGARKAEGGRMRRPLCAILFMGAAALVAVPQSLIHHHLGGSYTPIPGGSGLANLQYTEGLRLQRYETFVGGTPDQAPMRYLDPHTNGIVEGLEGGSVAGTGQYAEIVVKHPLTMLGVFVRHIVNGLDQRYQTPYVERLETSGNRLWRLAGFLIVFLALLRVLWPRARQALEPAHWGYPAVLLLACATSIASAVETRFLLPVFVLCAMTVVAPGWVGPFDNGAGLRRYRSLALITLAAILFFALTFSIGRGATNNLHLGEASSGPAPVANELAK
jgi:hypothetical protein